MPFKSEKQRRWMFANKPEMAKRWASEYHNDGGMAGAEGPLQMKKLTQKDRYGNQVSVEFDSPTKPLDPTRLMEKSMEMMQDVPMMMPPPVMGEEFNMGDPNTHPGGPRGEDTVPAWLTPGEFVVNAEATEMFGPEIEAMNEVGRMAQGGEVPPHMLKEGGGIRRVLPTTGEVWGAAADAAKIDPRGASETLSAMPTYLGMLSDYASLIPPAIFGFNEGGRINELNELTASMGWGKPLRPGTPDEVMAERAQVLGEAMRESERAKEEAFRWMNPATWGFNDGGAIPTPMPYDQALIEAREGYRDQVYADSLGKPTVGYGTHVPGMQIGSTPYTQAENRANMQEDLKDARQAAMEYVGPEMWDRLDRRQQGALVSQAYQLGASGQKKFVDMQAALQAGDAAGVRAAAEDSLWADQTPKRVQDVVDAFQDGSIAEAAVETAEEKPWWQFWQEGGEIPFVAGPLLYPPQFRQDGGQIVEGERLPWGQSWYHYSKYGPSAKGQEWLAANQPAAPVNPGVGGVPPIGGASSFQNDGLAAAAAVQEYLDQQPGSTITNPAVMGEMGASGAAALPVNIDREVHGGNQIVPPVTDNPGVNPFDWLNPISPAAASGSGAELDYDVGEEGDLGTAPTGMGMPDESSLPVPITNADLQQAEVWERQYDDRDPDDLGNAPTAATVPPVEEVPPAPEPNNFDLEIEDDLVETAATEDDVLKTALDMNRSEQTREEFGFDDSIIIGNTGKVQKVNPNRIDPSIPEDLARRFANGRLTREQYDTLLGNYHQAVKQNDAWETQNAANKETAKIETKKEAEKKVEVLEEKIAEAEASGDTVLAGVLQEEKAAAEEKVVEATAEEEAAAGAGQKTEEEVTKTSALETALNAEADADTTGDGGTTVGQTGAENGAGTGASSGEIVTAGENATKGESPQTITAKVQNQMQETLGPEIGGALGELFDAGELAKMGVYFVGAMAFGASPRNALMYGMDKYMKGIDNKAAARAQVQKTLSNNAFEAAKTGKFTQQSIQAYMATGNPAVLTPRDKAAKPAQRTGEKVFVAGAGLLEIWTDSNGKQFGKLPNKGGWVDLEAADTAPYDKATMGTEAVSKRYSDYISTSVGNANIGVEEDAKNRLNVHTQKLATRADKLFQDTIRNAKYGATSVSAVQSRLDTAIDNWVAYNKAVADGEIEGAPATEAALDQFYEAQIISDNSGISPGLVQGTSMEENVKINEKILRLTDGDPSKIRTVFQTAQAAWQLVPDDEKKRFDKQGGDNMSGFMYFVNLDLQGDPRAGKYIEQLANQ